MITNFFCPEIEDMDLDNVWFQQDGATSHTTRPDFDAIAREISRTCDFNLAMSTSLQDHAI